ncbi:MAG: hypothetical protein HW388_1297 [Dehalococcoidia bacterium]|nr:hypothetical protein [Dehalococcoidia bacterium]
MPLLAGVWGCPPDTSHPLSLGKGEGVRGIWGWLYDPQRPVAIAAADATMHN